MNKTYQKMHQSYEQEPNLLQIAIKANILNVDPSTIKDIVLVVNTHFFKILEKKQQNEKNSATEANL